MLTARSRALQDLRRLSGRRRARLDEGRFVVDGPTLVAEALASPVEVLAVYAEPDAAPDVVHRAAGARVPVHDVEPGALAKVTSPVTPQGVAAVAAIPPAPDPATVLHGLVVVLVGVADPGNAGTLFRVAEAAGGTAVVSCGDAVDVWNPKVVRASAGSIFRVPHLDAGDADAAVALLRAGGLRLVACDGRAERTHDRTDLSGDVAVLLGNEAHGLPPSVTAAADLVVRIPMAGDVESLNVAMTGTVMAFEAARQRRAAGGGAA